MLDLLIEGDHRKCRKFWAEKCPQMPQPETDEEAEVVMHHARTMSVIPTALRLWSHKWLVERGHPSALPENLKGQAERLQSTKAYGVGLSLSTENPALEGAVREIRKDMEKAVLNMMDGSGKSLPSRIALRAGLGQAYRQSSAKLFGVRNVR